MATATIKKADPVAIAGKFFALAEIKPQMMILNPCAGDGEIAKLCAEVVGIEMVDVCENDKTLSPRLHSGGFRVFDGDFLLFDPRNIERRSSFVPVDIQSIVPGDEIWKPIIGYESVYEISSHGRIRRLTTVKGRKSGSIRTGSRRRDGYVSASLCHDGRVTNFLVHRLVMESFVGPCPPGMQVNHKHPDGDKSRNWLSNLEYSSSPNNNLDQRQRRPARYARASNNPRSKLTQEQVVEIKRRIASGENDMSIARSFGVVCGTVSAIREGKSWKDRGVYDRVLFDATRLSDDEQAEHVMHAYDLLAPGGRLVAIMSCGPFYRTDAKSAKFRQWLENLDRLQTFDNPPDAFNGVQAFRQTGVNTRMIVIDRP